jgi:hypothetical protein
MEYFVVWRKLVFCEIPISFATYTVSFTSPEEGSKIQPKFYLRKSINTKDPSAQAILTVVGLRHDNAVIPDSPAPATQPLSQ